jgi:hypothetical protein
MKHHRTAILRIGIRRRGRVPFLPLSYHNEKNIQDGIFHTKEKIFQSFFTNRREKVGRIAIFAGLF